MNIHLREIRKYINEQSPEPRKVLAVLADIFPREKQDKNALNMLIIAGVVEEIRNSSGNLEKHRFQAIKNILVNDYFMQEAKANEAIMEWIEFYCGKTDFSSILSVAKRETPTSDKKEEAKQEIELTKTKVEVTSVSLNHKLSLLNVGDKFDFGKYNGQPITWRILKKDTKSMYVLSDKILDYQRFAPTGAGSNNWDKSEIRKWLNSDFYSIAFSEDEKKCIVNMNGDNITLLSKEEAKSLMTRQERVSDRYWWLRSPNHYNSSNVYRVGSNGSLNYSRNVSSNALGVRPAFYLKL